MLAGVMVNRENLHVGQLRGYAPLGGAVPHVVGLRSQKEVVRIYAGRNVTSVANEQTRVDWAIRELPGNAMRFEWGLSLRTIWLDNPVSMTVSCCRPKPASPRLVDLVPETLS